MSRIAQRVGVRLRPFGVTTVSDLHLRAAHQLVRLARRFQAEVRVHHDNKSVNGKSVLELLTLAARCGTRLDLEASGLDADEAVTALSGLIEARFHEDGVTAPSADAVERRVDAPGPGDCFAGAIVLKPRSEVS